MDQLFYWHQHSESVHGYSEIRSRSNVWKDTEGHIYDYTHFLLQILGLFVSYILGKWLQKEDIVETAVHFVLKWGFEINPVSNNSRMLETEDLGDIASAWNGVRWCKLGHPAEKNWLLNFLYDQSEKYGIM